MNYKLLICLLFAFLIRIVFLSSIPGFHVDEAILGQMSYNILNGEKFYFYGMNKYTGATIQYLRVPFMFLFGANIFGVRFVNVLFGVGTVYLAYLIFSSLFNSEYGLRAAWIFAVIPWHVIWSRIAWEITVFPFFILLILYFILCKNSWKYHFFAWIICGIALFTHVIFIAFLIPLALYVFFKQKKYSLCTLVVFLVMLYFFFVNTQQALPANNLNFFDYLIILPKLIISFFKHFDGSVLYLRTTGLINLFVVPFVSLSFLGSFFYYKKNKHQTFTWLMIASFLIITYFINTAALRYHLIPLTFTSLVLCYFFFYSKKIFFQIFVILSISYVSINFYYTFYTTGGSNTMFELVNFNETSTHFISLTPMLECVNKLSPKQIIVPDDHLFKTLKKPFIPDWWIVAKEATEENGVLVTYSYSFDSFPQNIISALFTEPCNLKNFRVLVPKKSGNLKHLKFVE
ncbi:glycosyltransferase family 39 protein [Candidatus Woesearchaeota archaeon]|nr:glycosyltransferase family 39 protein [Candidatus Woesearchaeota archaeon]